MASKQASTLAQAAAELTAAPQDLGAWLAVASALAGAGKKTDAARAFASLGAAASDLGQVALAAACARWLEQNRQAAAARKLISDLAATHGRGSGRIDPAGRPAPPPRGSVRREVAATPAKSLDAAVKSAVAAVDAARAAAEERAPERLPATPLVHALPPDDVARLVGLMKLVEHPAGHVVIDVGEPATALFWIARGAVTVTRGDHQLGELRSGAFFGEIALVGGTTRTARVTCTEPTWLLEIPSSGVEELAGKAPTLAKVLAEYARARLLANVMRTSPLFQRLSDAERAQLLARFVPKVVPPGTTVIGAGAANDTLYVVVSGRLEVRGDDGAVAGLLAGDAAGEISLLTGQPAVADVVAAEPTVVLTLPRDAFDAAAVSHPGLIAEVYKLKREREQTGVAAAEVDASELVV